MQLDGYDGRVALITGGARGIGRKIAETLRDQGAAGAAGDEGDAAVVAVELHGVLLCGPGVVGVRGGRAGQYMSCPPETLTTVPVT